MGREILYFACRHHTHELILRAVFETVWPVTSGPNVPIFSRFQQTWNTIDKLDYEIGMTDQFVAEALTNQKDDILAFITKQFEVL